MPEQRSATPAVPPPLPRRARTPAPTLAPAHLPAASAPALAAPAPAAAPAALPSAEEAEAILRAALRGEADADPARRAGTDRVLAALSEGERTALTSGPLSFDPVLLRTAAGLRLRLEVALTLVLARSDIHATIFPALLGEVDDFLLWLKATVADAPPGAAEALDPVRLALVDGGVALAGALARIGPAAPAPRPAAPFVSPSRPAPRVLSNVTAAEAAKTARGGKGLWVALGLAVAAAGGYHGYQYATRKPPAALPQLPGAPAHTFVIRQGASVLLNAEPGANVDAGELERFTLQERAKGNSVRAVGKGMWILAPAGEGAKP